MNAEQRASIVRALGGEGKALSQVADELEALIDYYREALSRERDHQQHRHASAPPKVTGRAARRVERAARELQDALDSSPDMLRQRLLVTTQRKVEPPDIFGGGLLALAAAAREVGADVRRKKATAGPKADGLRQTLDAGVAAVLVRNSLPVKLYADGVFARVLGAVQVIATGTRAPADARPRLRAAIRRIGR